MNYSDFKFEKKHAKEHFYKYTTFESAKFILENQTFRYSCPLIFNDPFDCQAGLHLEFNAEHFANLFIDKVESIVRSSQPPVFKSFNDFSKMILSLRKHPSNYGFPKAYLNKIKSSLTNSIAQKFDETHKCFQNNWENELKKMRCLCLSGQNDNILMWSHYADHHKGVVIELSVAENESEKDPLWLAQPVRYINKPEPLYNNELFDEILGITLKTHKAYLDIFGYVKYDVWKYENEWRVLELKEDSNRDLFEDNKYHASTISSIIFGCNCPDKKISELINLVQTKCTHKIKFKKASKNQLQYKLDFTVINC